MSTPSSVPSFWFPVHSIALLSRGESDSGVRRVLTSLKTKRTGAKKGHQLLKSKADALQVRFRAMLAKIMDVSTNL